MKNLFSFSFVRPKFHNSIIDGVRAWGLIMVLLGHLLHFYNPFFTKIEETYRLSIFFDLTGSPCSGGNQGRFHAYLLCLGMVLPLLKAFEIDFGRLLQKLWTPSCCVFTAFAPLFGMFLVFQNASGRFCAYVRRLRRFRA